MKVIGTAACILFVALPVLAQVKAILPVVGSAPGGFDSNFKTEVQLHNRGSETMRGVLVFHPQGAPATAGDPSASYELAPRQTLHFDDLVGEMGVTGLGSLDVMPLEGGIPAVVARAFDDQGAGGTNGATIRLIDPRDAIVPGVPGLLVTPSNLERFRFNLGVRSLAGGASMRITVYGQNGIARHTVDKTYAPDFFVQRPVDDSLGTTLLPNESILIEMLAGSAIVYGTTTDNVSNDPAIQNAARITP